LISDKAKLNIAQIVNFSKSSKNSYIKFLFGKKLGKPISIQAHAISANALKEFKRVGGEVDIIKFKKETSTKSDDTKKKVSKENKESDNSKKTEKKKIVSSTVKKKPLNKKVKSMKIKVSSKNSKDKPPKKA
jgi:hypothetical protein